ncbi:MAG TPA: metallophosphoesterase family protein [Anaerolineales bacterium]|nr:metallophosphoesterase family protein [Anaerolineales bacterium]
MTKLAILSDIHGNLPALEAVMEDMKVFDVDQIVVAGDVVNFGPFSRQTAEIVIEQNWPVIRGNNEYFLVDYKTPRAPAEWNDPLQFAPIAWLSRQFDQQLKRKIACWPDSLNLRFEDAPPVLVFHGTPNDPWDSIYWTLTDEEIEKLLSTVEAEFVICGHTHLPLDRQSGRWHIFNPGSVGVPLDGVFSASYMILEGNAAGWKPTFRRVPFDYEAIFQEFEASGYNDQAGPIGRLTVEIYKRARPVLGFLRWREKFKPGSLLTDELVEEFLVSADWSEFAHRAYLINTE